MGRTKQILPRAAVYVGSGASHSWTWFADIFDRQGYYPVCFLSEQAIAAGALAGCDVLFVSGGDTFAVAAGLGESGAGQIERFVRGGGTYIGACAGAYLPLHSSLPPLNLFNFVNARIHNLTRHLPAPLQMTEKFCTEYGCRYVFHPVREEVRLRLLDGLGDAEERQVCAPLYGGPAMLPSDDIEVLATYENFTPATQFLIEESVAQDTIIGTVAAARKKYGAGAFYLFGPHFEHPDYPEANKLLFTILFAAGTAAVRSRQSEPAAPRPDGRAAREAYRAFLSLVSNARIMALSLERTAYQWIIGKKVYDPEKIRVFLEAIWKRAKQIDAQGCSRYIPEACCSAWTELAREIIDALRQLRETESNASSDATAQKLFNGLRDITAGFLSIYFNLRQDGLLDDEGRLSCTTITCTSRQPQHSIHCR